MSHRHTVSQIQQQNERMRHGRTALTVPVYNCRWHTMNVRPRYAQLYWLSLPMTPAMMKLTYLTTF